MILFCPDLVGKEEVKAMLVGNGDFVRPVLHPCIKEKCVAYKDGKCMKYDNEVEERAFEDILYMIKRSCDKNFYKGTDYDGMKQEIVRCATDIYIEQMRQNGGKEDE